MSSDAEERRERQRVLLLFAFTIVPPLVLLTILAAVAVRNDGDALRYLEQEQALQAADRSKRSLEGSIRQAEQAVFDALDVELLRSGGDTDLQAMLDEHPIVARLFALTSPEGRVLWPNPALPFMRDPRDLSGAPLVPEEGTPEDLRRRADLLAIFDRSIKQADAGDVLQASRGYRTVAQSRHADDTLKARASYRLGECLVQLGEPREAIESFHETTGISAPPLMVLDRRGTPLRILSALRCAELSLELGDTAQASRWARELSDELLDGTFRGQLLEEDWVGYLDRARHVLQAAGGEAEATQLKLLEEAIQTRAGWLSTLERELSPVLLLEANAAGGILHHSRLDEPPLVVAYRLIPASPSPEVAGRHAGALVVGFQLHLEGLAREVLNPACGSLNQGEDAMAVAVLDARRTVVAYAGAEARPDAERRLRASKVPAATVSLEPVPLWSVWVARPTNELQRARTNRIWLYVALIGLTLATAVLGARSTIRYVRRSLELAKMKSDFLSNITHELKTPLTSIKMYGELMAMGRVKTEEKRAEYSQHIVRESDRLQKLIEDILDFARADSGAGEKSYVLAEEDVADTVAEAVDLFRASAKVRGFDLYVDLPPVGQLPPVDLDREAIVRAVLNLLSNGVKYSADAHYLRTEVKREGRDWIEISVEDKGIGIDPEDLERIFDRFYRAGDVHTRAVSGTGLGLSLVDQIVQAHGGQIRVESEKGSGSLFTIMLPIVADYRDQWPPPELPERELEGEDEGDEEEAPGAPPPEDEGAQTHPTPPADQDVTTA